jgi:antitoxin CcdA
MQVLYYDVSMTEIITVRVQKSLKAKLKKHKVDVSKAVREALEDEVKKREDAELMDAICRMKAILQKIPDDEIVRAIRESRDER